MDNNDKSKLKVSLRKRIKDKDPESNSIPDYVYGNIYDDRVYRFDLVELNQDQSIRNLYVLCSYEEYQEKLNALLKQLRLYHEVTNAEVFLSFKNDEGKLKVLSLKQLEIQKSKNPSSYYLARSFADYYSFVKEHIIGECVCKCFFRGQPNNMYEPIPSIFRNYNIGTEARIYHEAVRRLPMEFTEDMSTFDKLVKMQHYELPTRLLDVTTNPLVALYFACQKAENGTTYGADGEVLIYNNIWRDDIKYYDSDSVCILANLAKRRRDFTFEEKDYLIYDIKKEKPSFNGKLLQEEALHQVLCVLPKLNNDRIIKQDGAFFIFGMGKYKNEPASIPELPHIINIEADAKWEILQELELLGINEASLFPETDKIMKQIKNQVPTSSEL